MSSFVLSLDKHFTATDCMYDILLFVSAKPTHCAIYGMVYIIAKVFVCKIVSA